MNNQEFSECLSVLEQLIEDSPGFMGKKFVNEEQFYIEVLKIRKKLGDDGAQQPNQKAEGSPWSNPK